MTVINDWATRAARQIKYEWLKFMLEDPQLSQLAEITKSNMNEIRIAAIIAEHCPLKDNVACMPVPRCDQCRHWEQWTEIKTSHVGECGKIYQLDQCVQADFGCVQWEAK